MLSLKYRRGRTDGLETDGAAPLATPLEVRDGLLYFIRSAPWSRWFNKMKVQMDAIVSPYQSSIVVAWPGYPFTAAALSDSVLSVNLLGNRTYLLDIDLMIEANVVGGFQFDLGGTATYSYGIPTNQRDCERSGRCWGGGVRSKYLEAGDCWLPAYADIRQYALPHPDPGADQHHGCRDVAHSVRAASGSRHDLPLRRIAHHGLGGAIVIQIERTEDAEMIRAIMTHPRIYPSVADDFFPAPADFKPPIGPGIVYLMAWENGEPLGLFLGFHENAVEMRIHHFILPTAWGKPGQEAARLALEWVWANTAVQKVTGKTPKWNKLALRFARRMGMQTIGNDRNSIQKGGRLWDQIIFGMSRPGGNGHGN